MFLRFYSGTTFINISIMLHAAVYESHSCHVSICFCFLFYSGHSWAAFAGQQQQQYQQQHHQQQTKQETRATRSTALKMPIIIIATWQSSMVPRILLLSLPPIPPPLFCFCPWGQTLPPIQDSCIKICIWIKIDREQHQSIHKPCWVI